MPQDTTVQSLVLWAVALTTLFNFVSLVWTVFSGPSRKNSADIDGLKSRVGSIEQSLRMIPAAQELHELEIAMTELKGEIKTMSEAMRGQAEIMKRLESIVGRHEDHLLRK